MMSLDLSSLDAPVPKWQSDWTAAETHLIEHATALRSIDKASDDEIVEWVNKWVSCVDQVNAAQAIARMNGGTVCLRSDAHVVKEAHAFYTDKETKRMAEKEKALEAEAIVDEDEEMSDATIATQSRVVKTKAKGKGAGKSGYDDIPWPEEEGRDPSTLIFYNPKCSFCENAKGGRRCVGLKGAICFGCKHSRKQCTVYNDAKAGGAKTKPVIHVQRASVSKAGGSASVGRDDEIVEVEGPSLKRAGPRARAIRKSKSASVMDDRAVSPESLRDPDYGEMVMKDLKAQLKTWSMQGWRMAEDLCNLRESLFKDE